MNNSQQMHQKDKVQKFTYGKATFENIPQKIKKFIIQSKTIQTTLNNNEWHIISGRFKYYFDEIFSHMNACLAQVLNLWDNESVHIISQIKHIQYANLRWLDLESNKINNIQSLSSIHFNCLQRLSLDYNEISQIKCLNKLSTPSLNWITLYKNHLFEINALTRSKINSKLLRSLFSQFFCLNDPIDQDLSLIVKLNSESIKQLSKLLINMRHKIKQKNQSSQSIVNVKVEIPFY